MTAWSERIFRLRNAKNSAGTLVIVIHEEFYIETNGTSFKWFLDVVYATKLGGTYEEKVNIIFDIMVQLKINKTEKGDESFLRKFKCLEEI